MNKNDVIDASGSSAPQAQHHGAVASGLGQAFGILPSMALLTLAVDAMCSSAEIVSAGLTIPVSCAAGVVLGIITFLAQRKWYGDDTEAAVIKGIILAFLTSIPTPLPAILYVPSGIVGLVHNLRRK